ncbi:MAG: hypothetical protein HY014_06590 [Acidobacteria bacterium]|nr:hypothetical protein [Acidobacteriota bacterium]MBI3487817.1 hypothetical protein [Acidobacteriota bacterium]
MSAVWLFLYLGCLMRLLTLYRLDFKRPATFLLLLPVLLLPLMDRICRHQAWVLRKGTIRAAGLTALICALALTRTFNLGFADTTHLGLAAIYALMGLSLSVVAQAHPGEHTGTGLWIWVAAWEYAGTWHPTLTLLGAGLSGFLLAFGHLPEEEPSWPCMHQINSFWAAALLGLVLPKPGFDFQFAGTWPGALAVFALGVAIAGLPRLRELLSRVPNAVPLLLLGLAFVLYPSAWVCFWALVVGLLWGAVLPRFSRPLCRTRTGLGFAAGVVVSFTLHSNLGIPFIRRLLWLGS